MSENALTFWDDIANPLDIVEDVLNTHEWIFSRQNEDELCVEIEGENGQYRLIFIWQEEYGALQICAQMDHALTATQKLQLAPIIMDFNSKMWLGHFDILGDIPYPCFRYTYLLQNTSIELGMEQINDLVETALKECERFDPILKMALATGVGQTDQWSLLMTEHKGAA